MTNPIGIGAAIHFLSGGSPKNVSDYYGRKIIVASFEDNRIYLTFEDGVEIQIWDDGQSCCESRYITTDDNVDFLMGKTLKEIIVKEGPPAPDAYDVHEQMFLEIMTDKGCVTFCTHNEHNGYYGGFGLSVDEV